MSDTKICKGCGKIFRQKASVSGQRWAEQKFCSQICSNNSYKRNRVKEPKPASALKASRRSMLSAKSRAMVKRFFAKPVSLPDPAPPGDPATWGAIMPGVKWEAALFDTRQMGAI